MFASNASVPEPASDDVPAMLRNQASVLPYVAFSPRRDLERRAGGNFSWNAGVDYQEQLRILRILRLVQEDINRRSTVDRAADLVVLGRARWFSADDEPSSRLHWSAT